MYARDRWPEEDLKLLRDTYPIGGLRAALKAFAGRYTRSAIKNRVHLLQLKVIDGRRLDAWKPEEIETLKAMLKAGHRQDEIAIAVGRTLGSVATESSKLTRARTWSPEERDFVLANFPTKGCKHVAHTLLGRTDPAAIGAINSLAMRLGLADRRTSKSIIDRIRELNAQGMRDSAIAMSIYGSDSPSKRRRITTIRNRNRILAVPESIDRLREIGKRWQLNQFNQGVNPRQQTFHAFARRYGLPKEIPPRAVMILVYLAGGPRTRNEIHEACGITKYAHWNKKKNDPSSRARSYTGGLVEDGWIVAQKLPNAGHKGPRFLYCLTPKAIEHLQGATNDDRRSDQGSDAIDPVGQDEIQVPAQRH